MGHINVRKENKIQQQKYAARTGFTVDIQKIGKNTELIASKQKKSHKQIRQGVWLSRKSRTFRDGNFTNIYDLFWNSKNTSVFPQIYSSNSTYSLFDQVTNDQSILGVINGTYFFLADIADRRPHDPTLNFCIRDYSLIGLPSSDEPILYNRKGKLYARNIHARGVLKIGNILTSWIGEKSRVRKNSSSTAVLYNSNSATMLLERHPVTGVAIDILDNVNITTPISEHATDLLIAHDSENKLIVKGIIKGGGSHFFEGVFTLQITGNADCYNVGDIVEPVTLDGLKLSGITAGISIGRQIVQPSKKTHSESFIRHARSVIAKDNNHQIHFIVFDGSKYIPGFKGVSIRDIYSYFSSKKFKWAYFLDGGGSSRIILKKDDKFKFYANEFAFRKMEDGKHLWDWRNARMIASSIALKMHV